MCIRMGKNGQQDDLRRFELFKEMLLRTYGGNTFFSKDWLQKEWSKKEAQLKPKVKAEKKLNLSEPPTAPMSAKLTALREELGSCPRCKLCKTRTHIVYGEGSSNARLMFVGEGPGETEDLSGRPFVGRAGKLLDKIIEAMGLSRNDVYIANVVKCRPPENRRPEKDEIAACEPFLFKQIDIIKPEVIVALGATALECLLKSDAKITNVRGTFIEYRGTKLLPTYHPAYLLRNPPAKKFVWEDMKKVMKELNLKEKV